MRINTPSSSNIESMDYDPRTSTLVINYRSQSSYSYLDVPNNVWEELQVATSVGRYVAENIKPNYKCKKL